MAKTKKNDEREVIKGITPIGTITFSHLTEPDYTFEKAGSYNVKIRLSEEQATPILDTANRLIEEEYAKAKAACKTKLEESKLKLAEDLPIKIEKNDNAEPTGYYIFGAKMKASGVTETGREWTRQPDLFDSQGQKVKRDGLNIWGGSEVRVAYTMSAFNVASLGVGVSCRLEAVQIVKLVSGSERTAEGYGFDMEEGYTADTLTASHVDDSAEAEDDGGEGDF
jgi:hypothetical protein